MGVLHRLLLYASAGAFVLAGVWLIDVLRDRWRRAENVAELHRQEQWALGSANAPSPAVFFPVQVVPRQPLVSGFQILPPDEARAALRDDELVLAVEIDGHARAYPLNIMTGPQREIVNDQLHGVAIAATWCHLCHLGIVYDRRIAERTLTFAVSGMLWENNLVMVDEETGSLWSHLLGEAMRGPMQGQRLQVIPSVMTEWGAWRTRFPQSTAVFMPRSTGHYGGKLLSADSGLVLALAVDEQMRLWSFADLQRQPVVNDRVGDLPVLVVFDEASCGATAYLRRLADRELTFVSDNEGLIDEQTQSRWDVLTGTATAGAVAGQRLRRLPATVSDHAVWSLYHSRSQLWRPGAN